MEMSRRQVEVEIVAASSKGRLFGTVQFVLLVIGYNGCHVDDLNGHRPMFITATTENATTPN